MSRFVQLTAYKYGMQLAARDAGYASLDVFTKQAAALPGALIGAGLGVGLGAGVGAAADDQDRWRGAAVGAGLGGLAGAGIGGVAGHLMKGTGKAVAKTTPAVEKAAPQAEQAVAKAAPKAEAAAAKPASASAYKPGQTQIGGPAPAVPDASRFQGDPRAAARADYGVPGSTEHIRAIKPTQEGKASIPRKGPTSTMPAPMPANNALAAPMEASPSMFLNDGVKHESGIRRIEPQGQGYTLGSTHRKSPTPQGMVHGGMTFDPATGAPVRTPFRG